MEEKIMCSVCGREDHDWTDHLNKIVIKEGFGLWERTDEGFICGDCNKISSKPTRFCGYCGKWFTGVLVNTDRYIAVSKYMAANVSELLKEAEDAGTD